MKPARAVWFAVCCASTALMSSALGCAQIAGLTSDYRLGEAGSGGAVGASGGIGGVGGNAAGGLPAGGNAGASAGGEPSTRGGAGPTGGASGATGGAGATAGGAGASGGAAGSGAGIAGGGGGGVAGAAGGSAAGPQRIGFSEFHDSAAGGDNASSHLANATFSKPAGTAQGDLMLVFFGADHSLANLSGGALAVAGWTLLDQHENYGTDGQATYLMYKFAGAAEPDPIVFSDINGTPSGDGVQGLLSVYRGVSAASPINAYEVAVVPTGQAVTRVTTATPPITTTAANCLLIAGLSPDTTVDAPVISAWPQGFVENQVSVNNPEHPYPLGWANIYAAERHLAKAGTVPAGAFEWTVSSGGEYYGSLAFVLALSP